MSPPGHSTPSTPSTSPAAAAVDGVTHYHLQFAAGSPPTFRQVAPLQLWFGQLRAAGVIGRDPRRYGGVGFGNLSLRHRYRADAFVITASQLGDRAVLCAHDFAVVTSVDLASQVVVAHGSRAPSSEAMTHAQCYRADAHIGAVFHVHAPQLWRAAASLGLAMTSPTAPYGTPAMASEVERLLADDSAAATAGRFGGMRPGCALLAMGGHEDGIIATAPEPQLAGDLLLRALRAADL